MRKRTATSLLWAVAVALAASEASAAPPSKVPPPAAPPAAAPAADVEHQSYGRFGQVAIYRQGKTSSGVVVLLSDDEGWDSRADELARNLESIGALVIGLDLPYYERRAERVSQDCLYPAGDFEMLSKLVQKKLDLAVYTPPVLAGFGTGATYAYGALAQAPSGTFAGAVSLGFCPRLDAPHPLCTGRGLTSKAVAGGDSYRLEPVASLDQPWLLTPELPAPGKAALRCDDKIVPEDFAAKIKGAAVIAPPKKNGKKPAAVDLRAASGLKQAYLRVVNTADLSRPPETPAHKTVADLPLLELPVPGGAADDLVIIVSGDGGWAGLDREVASQLALLGYPVVGLNSLLYFWTPRTPESASADLARILRTYLPAWNRKGAVVIGYSLGAEVLPFMVNRLPADLLPKVKLLALLGPTRSTSFQFQLSEWLGHGGGENRPVLPEVVKLKGKVPVACIFGGGERAVSLCPILGSAGTAMALPGAHYLGNNVRGVVNHITHAISAVSAPPPPPAPAVDEKKPKKPSGPPPTGSGSGGSNTGGSNTGGGGGAGSTGGATGNRISLLAGFGAGLGAGFLGGAAPAAAPAPAAAGGRPAASAPGSAAAGPAEETTQYGRFGNLHLLRRTPHPREVALLFSGETGWDGAAAHVARNFAAHDFLAVGIDTAHYLGRVAAQHDCAYTAGSLENLSKVVQKRLGFPTYVHPVVAGLGAGAALAYGALAQAPPNTFQGGLGLAFCPALPDGQPLCPGHGLVTRKSARGALELAPARGLVQPWITLAGGADATCPAAAVAALAKAAPGGEVVTLPGVDHGFARPQQWQAALGQALDRLLALAATPQTTAALRETAGSPALPGLPVVEMTGTGAVAAAAAGRPLAIVLSGDGGWTGVDREVAKVLAGRDGMPVVGIDSLRYFWNGRTPDAAAADLAKVMRHYMAAWKRDQVVLAGYSLGADVLPFLASRLPADLLAKVRLIALLGPSHTTPFEIRVKDDKATEQPVLPEVVKLRGHPLLCIGGQGESDSLCPEIGHGLGQSVELHGSHAFDGDYEVLASHILRAAEAAGNAGHGG